VAPHLSLSLRVSPSAIQAGFSTDRGLELLGGVVMVLTFTSSLSVSAGEADVRAMLVESLGCNLAWGIIDAIV
jgi:hypothetical protein